MVSSVGLPDPLTLIEAAFVPPERYSDIGICDTIKRLYSLAVGVIVVPLKLLLLLDEAFAGLPERNAFQLAVDGFGPAWKDVNLNAARKLHEVASKNFDWGISTCDYQNMGAAACPNSQWAQARTPEQHPLQFDIWGRAEEIATKLAEKKITTFRFSIEWSAVQPEKGKTDGSVIKRYVHFAKALKDNGIKPIVTLHHFSEPQWFAAKGGFEKEENIADFVAFSQEIAKAMSDYVDTWCTINEPGIFAFMGWVTGDYPPGKCLNLQTAGTVLKNMLLAHVRVYDAIKGVVVEKNRAFRDSSVPKRRAERDEAACVEKVKVGIAHQVLRFAPQYPLHLPAAIAARYLNKIIDDPVVDFFKTGRFSYQIPFLANVTGRVEQVKRKVDFIGVQSYVQPRLGGYIWRILPMRLEGEDDTQMDFPSDPAAIYRALKRVSSIGKPMLVTETGIATHDEEVRARHMHRTLYAVSRAIEEKMDVRGFLPWSLTKNNEWHLDSGPDFGLCDAETLEPKPGAVPFFEAAKMHRERVELQASIQNGI